MKQQQKLTAGLICSLLLFNLFFWRERLGLNLLIFTIINLGITFYVWPSLRKNTYSKLFALGTLLLAFFVVFHHSNMSMVIYFFSYFIFIGFSFFPHHYQPVIAGLRGFNNLIYAPYKAIKTLVTSSANQLPSLRIFYYLKIILIPLLIVAIFIILYSNANEYLAFYTSKLFDKIGSFFSELSFDRCLFFLLSFILVTATMISFLPPDYVAKLEWPAKHLSRIRNKKSQLLSSFSMTGLKAEYQMHIITLAGLNLVLLSMNILDFRYVWTGKTSGATVNLKSHVHEGTYILIFTILLAMAVLIIFFRKNLNFYPANSLLKKLAYAWIIQNAILVISVGLRNWEYITWHGMAYKRIGVIIFLILVLYGLWTMYEKVKFKHQLPYVLQKNSLAVYLAFFFCSAINWDTFITQYNLSHAFKGEIDVAHLIERVSDKNLKILMQKESELLQIPRYPATSEDILRKKIIGKRQRFEHKMKKGSWLSWNYSDARTQAYLEEKN